MRRIASTMITAALLLGAPSVFAASAGDPKDTPKGLDVATSSIRTVKIKPGVFRDRIRVTTYDAFDLSNGKGSFYWQIDSYGDGAADYVVSMFGDPNAVPAAPVFCLVRSTNPTARTRRTCMSPPPAPPSCAGCRRRTCGRRRRSGGAPRAGCTGPSTGPRTRAGPRRSPAPLRDPRGPASPAPDPYRVSFTTSPPFITKGTDSSTVMSRVGSPATAIASAQRPAHSVPTLSCQPTISAATAVAERIACIGVIPNRT